MTSQLARMIAGEVTMAEEPGRVLRKWREEFGISQSQLADYLEVSPSLISDSESGRRRSPGVSTVRRYIYGLIAIDEAQGGPTLQRYRKDVDAEPGIIAMDEFINDVEHDRFIEAIKGTAIYHAGSPKKHLMGYTVIDSLRAIVSFSSIDYFKIYGWSSERALIFTGVVYGRGPMIAVRAHPLRPAMVVYHQPKRVDKVAIRLAELERTSLIRTDLPLDVLLAELRKLNNPVQT